MIMGAGLPVRLTLLIPAVENAIAGNAYRPGEVITTRAGTSVEVDNTDAEGRLVLCDALAYAVESKPDLLVDLATLTGAARVALGPELPALFSNSDDLAQAVITAGRVEQDPLWQLPLWQPYTSMNVAVPLPKHSWMFGHDASSQTVTSRFARNLDFSRATALPGGMRTRIQLGLRSSGADGSNSARLRAILSPPSCLSPCTGESAAANGSVMTEIAMVLFKGALMAWLRPGARSHR